MYAGIGLTVPNSFQVHAGVGRVISVDGSTIRVEFPLRKGRTFSVRDAASLTVHAPRGRSFENILFDAQGNTLCRFARGEKNGEVFLQYLRNQGVPFFRPDGLPADLIPSAPMSGVYRGLPRFTLQLRHTAPVGMWIGLGLFLWIVLFTVGVPVAAILSGPHIERNLGILLAAACIVIVAPWVLALVKGQLFPPVLTVEGDQVWLTCGLGWKELRLEEMDHIRFQRSDECYVLYSKQGRPVAKFSTRDDFGPQFMDFLTRHNIKLRSDP